MADVNIKIKELRKILIKLNRIFKGKILKRFEWNENKFEEIELDQDLSFEIYIKLKRKIRFWLIRALKNNLGTISLNISVSKK